MAPDPKLELLAHIPWSEPAWYRSGVSPYYDDSHRLLRKHMRDYIDANILPLALDWEAAGEVPVEEARRFCRSGIAFEDVPPRHRPADVPDVPAVCGDAGRGMDAFHLLVGADETARIEGGVVIGLAGASAIGVPPIIHYGTEEQKARWLPGLYSRETSFCLGITEPSGGSDVAQLRTTAEKSADGRSYVVHGAKKWITGAPWASHMTTAVRTGQPGPKGISFLVIPMAAPGVSVRRIENSGQKAGGASMVDLDGVVVPASNLIGKENEGFRMIMKNFNKERFLLAVQCNRKSRTCLALAFQYALQRETFGKKLMEYQVIRRKLGEVAHRVEAHWAWLEQVAYQVKESPLGWQTPEIAGTIALLKVQGGQMVELAAREAQQIFGGAGYQRGGPGATVEQISRDLRMLVVGGGSEEIITELALRQELIGFAKASGFTKEASSSSKL